MRLVFKHMPLSIHSKAREAHQAAEAAHLQGKFWPMHDRILAAQRQLDRQHYLQYAKEIGLDLERFQKDMKSDEVKRRIDSDSEQASKLGVTGTPAFFINGRFFSGAQPYEAFKRVIDEELSKAP